MSASRFENGLSLTILRNPNKKRAKQLQGPSSPNQVRGTRSCAPKLFLLPAPLSHQITSVNPTPLLLMGLLEASVFSRYISQGYVVQDRMWHFVLPSAHM